MSKNYLISLRNDKGGGVPGIDVGPTAYIEIEEGDQTYDLTKTIDPDAWLSRLTGTSVLVFVHGFGNDAPAVISRHNSIKPHLPPDFCLVTFDWPSGSELLLEYKHDKLNAKQIAGNLMSDCLQLLLTRFPGRNVHLFAHSMGAYVTENAFQAPKAIQINHVLMAAADVDRLNYQPGSTALANFLGKCADLTVYWSTDDEALQISEKMPINKGAVPLGLQGFPGTVIPDKCLSIACTGYYEKYVKDSPPPVSKQEYTHVWYLLYQPPAPPVNDFYSDMVATLQGLPTTPTRAPAGTPRAFSLQRPPSGAKEQ